MDTAIINQTVANLQYINTSFFNDSGNSTKIKSHVIVNYEIIATSFICCIGIVGNISNMVVLRMRRIHVGLDLIGRSAILGLLALAISDLMFCIIGVFSGILLTIASSDITSGSPANRNIAIVGFAYGLFRGGLMNIFLFISTWCITLLSLERYLVVCHPFKSRQYVNARLVVISRIGVTVLSVVINFPLFYRITINWYECEANTTCIYYLPRENRFREPLMTFHWISWAAIGTFGPLAVLLFANVRLIKEVSKIKDEKLRRSGKTIFHVTKTLVVIATSFILLVCPSVILNFLGTHQLVPTGHSFKLASNLTNICQAVKFSCNFLLYCTLNRSFRQNLCSMSTA